LAIATPLRALVAALSDTVRAAWGEEWGWVVDPANAGQSPWQQARIFIGKPHIRRAA
jgi:hypothetical protein